MCRSSNFIIVAFLCFLVGIGTVQSWKTITYSEVVIVAKQEVSERIEPVVLVELRQFYNNQPRQSSCEEIKEASGGFAPKKLTIKGGVLNKRTCPVIPIYPKEAIENKVDGQVNVQVLVDGFGKVKSAKAVSGNPLLWKSAVDAASKTRVCPFLLGGESVNARGLLIYKFVLPN